MPPKEIQYYNIMISQDTKKILSKLPDKPGVYFFVKKTKSEEGNEYKKFYILEKQLH